MNISTRYFLLAIFVSCLLSSIACADSPPSAKRKAELILKTSEPILSIAVDAGGNIYAVDAKGTVVQVLPDGKTQELFTGLDSCGFSSQVISVYDSGHLLVNTCENHKDVLLKIDQHGGHDKIMTFDGNLRSMAVDPSGRIYLGFWKTEGNLTVNAQPFNYLAGAENMWGEVSVLEKNGSLHEIYQGGIPMTLSISNTGQMYSAIWGTIGRYSPASQEYSVCGPKNRFWITLSGQTVIHKWAEDKESQVVTDKLNSASYVAVGGPGIFAFGRQKNQKNENCGIFRIDGHNITKLDLGDETLTNRLTDIAISEKSLYFSDANGMIYRIHF